MQDSHYLVSVTFQKVKDIAYPRERVGNPFCILEVGPVRKSTSFRFRTANPVWNERIDIVTDEKPSMAILTLNDFAGKKKHVFVGKYVLDLSTLSVRKTSRLRVPLKKTDVVGEEEDVGDLFLQVNFKEIDSKRHHHYSWTNILHLDVLDVENLPLYAQCLESDTELHLQTNLGVQQFSSAFTEGSVQKLESSGFFFVDSHSMAQKSLQFSLIMKRNLRNDILIGEGNAIVKDLENNEDNKTVLKNVILHENVEKDGLIKRPIGKLNLSAQFVARSLVEERVTEDIFDEYDYDFDGRLNKEEIFDMMATLHPSMEFKEIFEKINDLLPEGEGKEFVSKKELITFLRSSELHDSPFLNLIVIAGLKGRSYPSTAHFLRGFSYPSVSNCMTIKVIDRSSKETFEEKIPMYVSLAQKLRIKTENVENKTLVKNLLPRLSDRQMWHFDTKKSRSEIFPFMALNNIEVNSIERPVSSFKNFSEFLARRVDQSIRKINSPENPSVAIAPADCRLIAFEDINRANRLWVKGKDINLRSLVCNEKLAANFIDGSILFCRMAPQDAHSWSSPVDGVQGLTTEIDGRRFVVHPFCDNLDRLHKNKRVISEIVSLEFGSVLLVAFNGPTEKSVGIETKLTQELLRGDPHGHFGFGGNTLLVFFEKGRIAIDRDLLENSNKSIETYVRANTKIGIALKKSRLGSKYL